MDLTTALVKTPASWKVHALSTRPGMPSGPTALRMFTRLKDRVTSATERESGRVLGGMTKNVYHGIFLNYTGFTVYTTVFIFFMHDRVLTTFSTD